MGWAKGGFRRLNDSRGDVRQHEHGSGSVVV